MGTPYFRCGIVLGDRPVTTTGRSFVSASLLANDYLTATEFERTGATPFTGAYTFNTSLTYGFCVCDVSENWDMPDQIDDYPSGNRFGHSTRGARQSIPLHFTNLSEAEAAMYRRFFQMVVGPEGGRVIELVNEHGDAIPGRIRACKINKRKTGNASLPFEVDISFDVEHTSEQYSYRSGGQVQS